jgi:hypothetical protein
VFRTAIRVALREAVCVSYCDTCGPQGGSMCFVLRYVGPSGRQFVFRTAIRGALREAVCAVVVLVFPFTIFNLLFFLKQLL